MKKQLIVIGILILLTTIEFSGCTETQKTIEPLTDTDWTYFVWQHNSTDTITYYMSKTSNLTSNITRYIKNTAFYKLDSTIQNFTQLNATAKKWNQIILQNSEENSKFNLSSRMNENRNIYKQWLNDNRNISQIHLDMAKQFFLNNTQLQSTISNYLNQASTSMTSAQKHLTTLMNWFNNTISEEEWNTWTANRDWSFLDKPPGE